MAYTNPTVLDFTSFFVRDFPYGSDQTTVMDQDIQNGLNAAAAFINQALFPSQPAYTVGYLNLAAHFMVMSLRASSQGIAGQYSWLNNSKSAGPVSEGLTIPQQILDNPLWSMLTKTTYGAAFLGAVLPYLIGQVFTVCGGTNP